VLQFGMPLIFLHLSAELRVQIYRYVLDCARPIDLKIDVLEICDEDKPAVHLLRVYKQIHREDGQVFYGDNTFRF
jgi:hypothetical protein